MLAGADDDGIELALMIEEPAEVGTTPRLGKLDRRRIDGPRIDVAQSDNVLGADRCQVSRPAPADADDGNVEPIVDILAANEIGSGQNSPGGCGHETTA